MKRIIRPEQSYLMLTNQAEDRGGKTAGLLQSSSSAPALLSVSSTQAVLSSGGKQMQSSSRSLPASWSQDATEKNSSIIGACMQSQSLPTFLLDSQGDFDLEKGLLNLARMRDIKQALQIANRSLREERDEYTRKKQKAQNGKLAQKIGWPAQALNMKGVIRRLEREITQLEQDLVNPPDQSKHKGKKST